MRRLKLLLLGLGLLLVISACRVDSTVTIDVTRNGSGTVSVAVELDADAAQRVPDLAQQLRVDDLRAAGWVVDGPVAADAGGIRVVATKPFASPDDLPMVLNEIGAFNNVSLVRSREFGATTWQLDGEIDVTGGVDRFGDAELAALLGGRMTGVDVAAIETELRKPIADMMGMTVVVSMADEVEASAADTDGRTATWIARIDDVAPTPIQVVSSVKDERPRFLALLAILFLGGCDCLVGWCRRLGSPKAVSCRLRRSGPAVRCAG